MPLKEFAGAAPATRLSNSLAVGAITNFSVITSGGNGYPSGSTAPFVVVIDRGTSLEEKILVGSRAGDTFSDLTRGYDGTTPQEHAAQAVVEHVLDAATITEANAHVNDDARDDHSQYLNTSRHSAIAHTGAMIQDLAVGTADLADQAVTSAKLEASQRWSPGDFKQGIQTADHTGWLLCDGRAVSIATYGALWAAMGSAHIFGADPGGGNFLLPDLRKKVLMGKAASGVGSTLGGSGGTADSIVVSHNHTQNAHNHTGSSSGEASHSHSVNHDHALTGGNHSHQTPGGDYGFRNAVSFSGANEGLMDNYDGIGITFSEIVHENILSPGDGGTPLDVVAHSGSSGNGSSHSHPVTVNNQTATNQSQGSSGTDQNLPPFMAVNGFIHI